jgi:hypothetical protein
MKTLRCGVSAAVFLLVVLCQLPPVSRAQSGSFSSITATSSPDPLVPIPIFSISRSQNVITVSTVDPGDPDQYAQQSNQVGATVTVAQVTADPSNTANGTFVICGPATPGCITPTTSSFSYVNSGENFSASGASPVGLSAVARVPCGLIPAGYFSFCGDARPGGGIGSPSDGSLLEIISTQDEVGTTVWASTLGDGNTGTTRATGCEQLFIESGNEWRLQCGYMRRYGGSIDLDIKNNWLTFGVGDGQSQTGTGAEFAMNGPRQVVSFGILQNRALEINVAANSNGAALPTNGTLRFPNGAGNCWENVENKNGLCATVNANDVFSLDGGLVTPAYRTTTVCSNPQGQCGNAAAGWIVFPAGSTSTIVYTTTVTAQSQIFVQEDSSISGALNTSCNATLGRTYQVTTREAGVGFMIAVNNAPTGAPACLSYHIVN